MTVRRNCWPEVQNLGHALIYGFALDLNMTLFWLYNLTSHSEKQNYWLRHHDLHAALAQQSLGSVIEDDLTINTKDFIVLIFLG